MPLNPTSKGLSIVLLFFFERKIVNVKTAINVVKLLASANRHVIKHNNAINKYSCIIFKYLNTEEQKYLSISTITLLLFIIDEPLAWLDLILEISESIYHDTSINGSIAFEDKLMLSLISTNAQLRKKAMVLY